MMKCLAPLLFIASSVAPHAEMCPPLQDYESFTCQSSGSGEQFESGESLSLSMKTGRQNGSTSYEITGDLPKNVDAAALGLSHGRGRLTFVNNHRTERREGSEIKVTTASCQLFKELPEHFPAIFVTTQVKDGPVQSVSVFYPQNPDVLMRWIFDSTGRRVDKSMCRRTRTMPGKY